MSGEQLDPRKYTIDNTGTLRPDFLFSYWILLWFIIYYFLWKSGVSSETGLNKLFLSFNPMITLIFAFIENVFAFIVMFPRLNFITRMKYGAMILTIKMIPIYLLRNRKINYWRDLFALFVVFALYVLWLYYNNATLESVYKKTMTDIESGENRTPLFRAMEYIWGNIRFPKFI